MQLICYRSIHIYADKVLLIIVTYFTHKNLFEFSLKYKSVTYMKE